MSEKALSKGSPFPKLEKGKLRIYGMRFCPYVKRVRLVLAAKDIPHEIVNINLKSKPDWFIEKNSAGKVPTLEQDDKLLTESIIIADYLDEMYPERKLSPKDPYLHARSKMVLNEFEKVSLNILQVMMNQFNGGLLSFDSSAKAVLRDYEKLLSNSTRFFAGDKPGMLDYMIWPWFEYTSPVISESDYPLILKWIDNMKQDAAVQKVAIPVNVFAVFSKSYIKSRDTGSGIPDYDAGLSV